MNRFYLMPKPKPEFKMVQPLPAFFEISTAGRTSAGAPEAVAPVLKQNHLTMLQEAAKRVSFTSVSNVTS
jgi:hypothetical protein